MNNSLSFAPLAANDPNLHSSINVFMITFAILLLLMYWMPSFIAFMRRHQSRWAILLVNTFFGFTCLGWLLCFFWSILPRNYGSTTVTNNYYRAP